MSTMAFPRATGNPRELPELRAKLVELAKPNSSWYEAEYIRLITEFPPDSIPEGAKFAAGVHADNTLRWYRENLPEAQLIHVSPEMTEFISAAAESAPVDTTLSPDDAPSPTGFVVFGSPVWGTDALNDIPIRVDAMMWARVALPSREGSWWDNHQLDPKPRVFGISIACFRLVAPEHDDVLATNLKVESPFWLPLGRTDWPWGDVLDQHPTFDLPAGGNEQWKSMMEDRRMIVALWATINQKRLVETMSLEPDKYVRKRLERSGHGGRDETVQIVHLRRSERVTLERDESEGRHVSVRFPVRPFYRRQRCGPGLSQTKLILVPGHWRGPDDGPIVHHERVWEVDR